MLAYRARALPLALVALATLLLSAGPGAGSAVLTEGETADPVAIVHLPPTMAFHARAVPEEVSDGSPRVSAPLETSDMDAGAVRYGPNQVHQGNPTSADRVRVDLRPQGVMTAIHPRPQAVVETLRPADLSTDPTRGLPPPLQRGSEDLHGSPLPSGSAGSTGPPATPAHEGTGTSQHTQALLTGAIDSRTTGTLTLLAAISLAAGALLAAAASLYSRIRDAALPEQELRAKILDCIRERPGSTASDVAASLSIHKTTAIYHLRRLSRAQHLVERANGRRRHYFVPGAAEAQCAVAHLAVQRATARTLRDAALAQPGLTVRDATSTLGLDRSTVHYHLRALSRAGVLRTERAGKELRIFPTS